MLSLRNALHMMTHRRSHDRTLQVRLLMYVASYVLIAALGVFIILLLTGVFSWGEQQTAAYFEQELEHISQNLVTRLNTTALYTDELSKNLSAQIETIINGKGFSPSDLQTHTSLISPILEGVFYTLTTALELGRTSGAFMLIDTTVNPLLPEAQDSKAGFFIKNMEPNALNATFPNFRYLRGPYSIVNTKGMQMLPQWRMESNIHDSISWKVSQSTSPPLDNWHQQYFWSYDQLFGMDNEGMLICSSPMFASEGTFLGICGYEISKMMFKLAYSPDTSKYLRIYAVLAPATPEGSIQMDSSLNAGHFPANMEFIDSQLLQVSGTWGTLNEYLQVGNDNRYVGLSKELVLYSPNSPYSDDVWTISLVALKQEVTKEVHNRNLRLVVPLALLIMVLLLGTIWFSKRYLKPVLRAFEGIQRKEVHTSDIKEINDLLEFLAANESAPATNASEEEQFHQFKKNIKTLSAAERSVFNLYMKGFTAREIADILCLSINTIKTHNKKIYQKLNVSSRKELLKFVIMMDDETHTKEDDTPKQ